MIVRKRYINDAITLIQNSAKKGAKMIRQVLENAKSIARQRGLAEERLYVKECIIGRALGQRKMDIRARGKFGMIHSPKSSIRVVLEEKPLDEFYKLMV